MSYIRSTGPWSGRPRCVDEAQPYLAWICATNNPRGGCGRSGRPYVGVVHIYGKHLRRSRQDRGRKLADVQEDANPFGLGQPVAKLDVLPGKVLNQLHNGEVVASVHAPDPTEPRRVVPFVPYRILLCRMDSGSGAGEGGNGSARTLMT
jgi:hypothetical protein